MWFWVANVINEVSLILSFDVKYNEQLALQCVLQMALNFANYRFSRAKYSVLRVKESSDMFKRDFWVDRIQQALSKRLSTRTELFLMLFSGETRLRKKNSIVYKTAPKLPHYLNIWLPFVIRQCTKSNFPKMLSTRKFEVTSNYFHLSCDCGWYGGSQQSFAKTRQQMILIYLFPNWWI